MFEFVMKMDEGRRIALCVKCRLCRTEVTHIRTYIGIPITSDEITSNMDLHVCSGQIGQ